MTRWTKTLELYILIRSCSINKPKWRQKFFIGTFQKSVEISTSCFWKASSTYWYFEQNTASNSRIEKPLAKWTKTFEFYILNLFYTFATLDTLIMISIEVYCVSIPCFQSSIGRFYNRLRHFANAQKVVSIRSGNVCTILLFIFFSLLYLPILLLLFLLVTIGVVYVNSVKFKHIDFQAFYGVKLQRLQS